MSARNFHLLGLPFVKDAQQNSLDTSVVFRAAAVVVIIIPKCLWRVGILTVLEFLLSV